MKLPYEAPSFSSLGTVQSMTLTQSFNKIGHASDAYSATTPLLGSLTPV